MRICKVKLNAFGEIRAFVEAASNFDDAVDIVSGVHKVNAKSLRGRLTLGLSRPGGIRVHGDDPEEVVSAIDSYLVA